MPRRITMRPRAGTSVVPSSCADVNEGLIEVSSSLFKVGSPVKLPSASRRLALRGSHRFQAGGYIRAMARGRSLPLLADEAIRLVPLTRDHEPDVARLVQDDAVRRHTRVPTHPSAGFAREWIRVYEDGWRGRTRAGFAIESLE